MAKRGKAAKRRGRNEADKVVVQEDEQALWEAFTKGVEPLNLDGRVADTDEMPFEKMLRRETQKAGRVAVPDPGKSKVNRSPSPSKAVARKAPNLSEVDAKQVRRLGSGRAAVDARIDLHGLRQHEAHGALRVFLFRAFAKGHRMVLVITGKGRSQDERDHLGGFVNEGPVGRGVLRRNVPLWLMEPDLRAIVVGYTTAHIKHGGEGALYVQLRRNNSSR